jgi:hypothetical protein
MWAPFLRTIADLEEESKVSLPYRQTIALWSLLGGNFVKNGAMEQLGEETPSGQSCGVHGP